jgi:hypothetical protein
MTKWLNSKHMTLSARAAQKRIYVVLFQIQEVQQQAKTSYVLMHTVVNTVEKTKRMIIHKMRSVSTSGWRRGGHNLR